MRKLAHFSPQLKEIMEALQRDDIIKSRELEDLMEHIFISKPNFDHENEPDYKYQKLYLRFRISPGETTKKPSKKKVKRDDEAARAPKIEFEYTSKWKQDRHAEHIYSAHLRVSGLAEGDKVDVNLENSNDDDDDDGKEPDYEGRAIKDKKRVLSFYGGKSFGSEASITLRIEWEKIDEILTTLRSSVNPAHLLEVLRCCTYYSKATRISPDKWHLPTVRPADGGAQLIENPMQVGPRRRGKTIPTTREEAQEFVDGQVTKLGEDLVNLCEKLETAVLPVYVTSIFIHASPLKETSTRKHELEVEVVLVVEKEDYGSIKTSAEHKIIAPLLDDFSEGKKVYKVYREYQKPLDYLPILLSKKVPSMSAEERKRLMTVYHPWFNHLSRWSQLAECKGGYEPWVPTRIASHMLKSNLNIKVELKTAAPPTRPLQETRSQTNVKCFVHLWSVGTDKGGLEEIIKNEVDPVANTIIAAFSV